MKHNLKVTVAVVATCMCGNLFSQHKAEEKIQMLKYGNLDHWTVREISESGVLGGKTKQVFVIAPGDTIRKNQAFKYIGVTPWSSSNAYARVCGVTKTSTTAFPERRGNGFCARLETKMEVVKVVGLLDISLAISGSIFLGETIEPVTNPNNPYKKLNMGVPFTDKPKALMLDYKCIISGSPKTTKAQGFGISQIPGHDEADAYIFLQKRWEDSEGNVFAKRIGTCRKRFDKTVEQWQNDYRIPILYGNITNHPEYKSYMGLMPKEGLFCCKNSKGDMVPIQEVGWGEPDEEVTHMILMISSGRFGAFIGTIGNTLWVDNIRLVY